MKLNIPRLLFFIPAALAPLTAHAVVVRGTARDAVGRAIPAAQVRVVQGREVIASAISGRDGSYVVRAVARGRFLLIATAPGFSPMVSDVFYGGDLDLVEQDLTLTVAPVQQEVTVTAAPSPIPVAQSSASTTQILADQLQTRATLGNELRLQPGVSVVQAGQAGAQTSLFVRGANSSASAVLVDGVPANDIGGGFDFGPFSTTALARAEVERGPDSALYGTDALAGVVRLETPRGASLRPILNYSGDGGNLGTYRNEVELSGTENRLDLYGAFSRFDTRNALPHDAFHVTTAAGSVGYNLSARTSLRGTVRQSFSATGLPGPYDFAGLAQVGKEGDQDTLISAALAADRLGDRLHLDLGYFGTRKREQSQQFTPVGLAVAGPFGNTYYGSVVTIRGANGTEGTGQAAIAYDPFPARSDLVSNRDGARFTALLQPNLHLRAALHGSYADERGSDRSAAYFIDQAVHRVATDLGLNVEADVKHRVFVSAGAAAQHNTLFGTEVTPVAGIAAYPVRPGRGWFRGTKVRGRFSKGVQEPDLFSQTNSLEALLLSNGDAADVQRFHVSPIGAQQARSYEAGVDQNIRSDRAQLRLTYFHNQYGRQIEYVAAPDLQQYFGVAVPSSIFGADVNSLAFRATGFESELEAQLTDRFFVRGGYTLLNSHVQRSFSGDVTAALGGFPAENPNYPGVPIGSSSPLLGARPFRRAPQTGFAVAQWRGERWNVAAKAAFSSRSDDSTFLAFSDRNGGNTLLLPNRNLAYGFTRLDLSAVWKWTSSVRVFTQVDNVLNQQHQGPIGYPTLPLTFRAGVKLRFPGE